MLMYAQEKEVNMTYLMKMYTVKEVAEMLRTHRQLVVQLIKSGKLNAFRKGVGSRSPFLIHENSFRLFLEQATLETMKEK